MLNLKFWPFGSTTGATFEQYGCGQVVSVFALYSNDPSLNPA